MGYFLGFNISIIRASLIESGSIPVSKASSKVERRVSASWEWKVEYILAGNPSILGD